MISSILVVCEGNICRSPMAEGLLRQNFPSINVGSAGVNALIGHAADELATDVLRVNGIDISSHRAVQLSVTHCQRADLILVMQGRQQRYIETRYPFSRGRVFQLGYFGKFEVPDPYRLPREQFELCFVLIKKGIADWVERIGSLRR